MPGVTPGQPIAPGIVTNPNQFPQYGVGGGTPGQAGGWNIRTANNNAEKMADINDGYVAWFSSRSAAQNFISSESSQFGSGSGGPLAGLAAIGDFFSRLTQPNTWIRVGEFAAGFIVLYIGLKAITSPQGAKSPASSTTRKLVTNVAKKTPAGKTASIARKVK